MTTFKVIIDNEGRWVDITAARFVVKDGVIGFFDERDEVVAAFRVDAVLGVSRKENIT